MPWKPKVSPETGAFQNYSKNAGRLMLEKIQSMTSQLVMHVFQGSGVARKYVV